MEIHHLFILPRLGCNLIPSTHITNNLYITESHLFKTSPSLHDPLDPSLHLLGLQLDLLDLPLDLVDLPHPHLHHVSSLARSKTD